MEISWGPFEGGSRIVRSQRIPPGHQQTCHARNHEIDQIMTCSVWLKQVWIDKKLSWDPKSYGGVSVLYVPYEMIWVPDIVLYNNADSNYNITISTKATLHYSGEVTWEPPAIFKSMCQIDVRWYVIGRLIISMNYQ
ncbi:Neurotransmitter-gated ion-channel ligand binding domain protein [Ostertagia ostertagi]